MLILELFTMPSLGSLASEALIIVAAALVLFLVFSVGRSLIRFIIGLLVNTILGLAALYLLDQYLGAAIPMKAPELAATIIFGLAGVGTMLILKVTGVF